MKLGSLANSAHHFFRMRMARMGLAALMALGILLGVQAFAGATVDATYQSPTRQENPPVEPDGSTANTGTLVARVWYADTDGGTYANRKVSGAEVTTNSYKSHKECPIPLGHTDGTGKQTFSKCPVANHANGNNYAKKYYVRISVPNGYRVDNKRASANGYKKAPDGSWLRKLTRLKRGKTTTVDFVLVKITSTNTTPASVSQVLPDAGSFDSTYEAKVLELVNQYRADNNLRPLKADPIADEASRRHTRDMIDKNYFSHYSPEPEKLDVQDWLLESGYPFDHVSTSGENIGYGSGALGTPEEIVKAWIRSDGHRENMLNPDYVAMGVGTENHPGFHGADARLPAYVTTTIFITWQKGAQTRAATSDLTPLHEYVSTTASAASYSTTKDNAAQASDGYDQYQGCTAQVYGKLLEGTRPLYEYWNTASKQRFYTFIKDDPLYAYDDDYVFRGNQGYVYPGTWPRPEGTVPFKWFRDDAVPPHNFYTTNPAMTDGYKGYHLKTVTAWVMPPPSDCPIAGLPGDPPGGLPTPSPSPSPDDSGALYRGYCSSPTDRHWYTKNKADIDAAIAASSSCHYDGITAYTEVNPSSETTPLYHVYCPRYVQDWNTNDENQKNSWITNDGCQDRGSEGNLYKNARADLVPLYWYKQTINYDQILNTATDQPCNHLTICGPGISGVWTYIGIIGYVRPPNPASTGIALPRNATVQTTVTSRDPSAFLAVSYALASPQAITVCTACAQGASGSVGTYTAGTTLVFKLTDSGGAFLSTDPKHAKITKTSADSWTINWDDSWGDGDFDDIITAITLS